MEIKKQNITIYTDDNSLTAQKINNGDEYAVVDNKIVFTGNNFNIKKIVQDFEKRIKKLEDKLSIK